MIKPNKWLSGVYFHKMSFLYYIKAKFVCLLQKVYDIETYNPHDIIKKFIKEWWPGDII